ncbi:MAG: hypothetical protein ABI661_11070 [Gammaproteobacteria bacterium]
MWRRIRIGFLLLILFIVAGGAWSDRQRTTDWKEALWVGVFPVNADGRPETGRYIAALEQQQYAAIEEFFAREAAEYGLPIDQPVKVVLYPEVSKLPPQLERGAGVVARVLWSLELRYYTWRQAGDTPADIRVFVLYHNPETTTAVPHSLGLQAGLLGVVHAYADEDLDEPNNVVIAHEVLHTVGATDKYDPATNLPLFPQGYGEPDAEPRFPQVVAEVMAGRIPLTPELAEMPAGLGDVVIGPQTAAEIRWTK